MVSYQWNYENNARTREAVLRPLWKYDAKRSFDNLTVLEMRLNTNWMFDAFPLPNWN